MLIAFASICNEVELDARNWMFAETVAEVIAAVETEAQSAAADAKILVKCILKGVVFCVTAFECLSGGDVRR
jgi:hypothetical protein